MGKMIDGCRGIISTHGKEDICCRCKQARLCDITTEQKEKWIRETGNCKLFIEK